jgi:diguanylate cyclase (GGDEF)-like protein/PAS domain S-box-containing protein
MQSKIDENSEQLVWILFTVLLFSLPLSYYLAAMPSRLKQEVDELNNDLQNEAHERDILLSLFDLSDAVLFKWNNDETWSVSSVSNSVKSLIGYSKEDFETQKVLYSECIHKDDIANVIEEVTQAVEENKYFFTHEPYRIITKTGEERWILDYTVIVRNKKEEVTHFVGYLSDITELKEKEFMLQKLARTDQLTQIKNRVYLDEHLTTQYYRFQRNEEPCSVILLDIDFFKSVNDDYSHLVGDKILIQFAQLLKSSIREGDIVGRWGGEEFLIILPHTNIEQAAILAEKLRKKIDKTLFDTVGHKTASFGVACFTQGVTIEKLIDNADSALYEAKESGRNNVKVYKEK